MDQQAITDFITALFGWWLDGAGFLTLLNVLANALGALFLA